jgi:hypothetical protein
MKIGINAWIVLVSLLFIALVVNTGCNSGYTTGRGDLDPLPDGISFEIKYILDPEKTVDSDGSLKPEIVELYNNALPWIGGAPTLSMANVNRDVVQFFIDSYNRDLFNAGWYNRIRHHVNGGKQEKDVQLTYRKRINAVSGRTRMTEADAQAAYMQAKKEGTYQMAISAPGGIGDNVELDWSYDSCTLTLSYSTFQNSVHFPGLARYENIAGARDHVLKYLPRDQLKSLNLADRPFNFAEWYEDKIENGTLFGPAYIRRYRTNGSISKEDSLRIFGGEKIQNVEFDIEVMPFHGSYIVELSSSSLICYKPGTGDWANFEHVTRLRKFMHDISLEAGILLPESGLKTSQIIQTMRQPLPRDREE